MQPSGSTPLQAEVPIGELARRAAVEVRLAERDHEAALADDVDILATKSVLLRSTSDSRSSTFDQITPQEVMELARARAFARARIAARWDSMTADSEGETQFSF